MLPVQERAGLVRQLQVLVCLVNRLTLMILPSF